ncbi:MAG TPA: hypothetical protein VMI72_17910 [Roseiarcus sp.]|nr:hypothetical protein [Roseiarcus sp.]
MAIVTGRAGVRERKKRPVFSFCRLQRRKPWEKKGGKDAQEWAKPAPELRLFNRLRQILAKEILHQPPAAAAPGGTRSARGWRRHTGLSRRFDGTAAFPNFRKMDDSIVFLEREANVGSSIRLSPVAALAWP